MSFPSLDDLLLSLSSTFPVLIQFVLVIMSVVALYLTLQALMGIYGVATDPTYGTHFYAASKGSVFAHLTRLVIAGALAVPAVLLWRAADTFVLGGEATGDLLTYLPGDATAPYCEQLRYAITGFFMVVGVIAIFTSMMMFNARADGRGNISIGSGLATLVGGVALFFITDVSGLIARSTGFGMSSLSGICTAIT